MTSTTAQQAMPAPLDRLALAIKESMKLFPAIKDRVLNTRPEDQSNGFSEIIQFFDAIDHELQTTCEQLSLSLDEVIVHASERLSSTERDMFYEAYGFWITLRKQSTQPQQPKPVRKLPKVSSLRIRI